MVLSGQRLVRVLAGLALLGSTGARGQAQGPQSEGQPSIELPPALARVLRDYEQAWQAKNPCALAALFAEDGFVLSGGTPPVRGRAAIEKLYTGRGGPLVLRAFHYATEGKIGYILGGYAREAGLPDAGKFTLTLRQGADGRWLIVSDMDNGNSRP
jgi:ketosteroid isomerase-like protein